MRVDLYTTEPDRTEDRECEHEMELWIGEQLAYKARLGGLDQPVESVRRMALVVAAGQLKQWVAGLEVAAGARPAKKAAQR